MTLLDSESADAIVAAIGSNLPDGVTIERKNKAAIRIRVRTGSERATHSSAPFRVRRGVQSQRDRVAESMELAIGSASRFLRNIDQDWRGLTSTRVQLDMLGDEDEVIGLLTDSAGNAIQIGPVRSRAT